MTADNGGPEATTPAPRRSRSWAPVVCTVLLLAGAALLYLPFHTQRELQRWARELREHGRPAQALVYDLQTTSGGNRSSPKTTMFFRYELDGTTYEQEVGCVEVCLDRGQTVSIWVSRTDPGDFVTDFGKLSGHRGRLQGGLGVVGFCLLIAAAAATAERRRRIRSRQRPRVRRAMTAGPKVERQGFRPRSKHKGSERMPAPRRRRR